MGDTKDNLGDANDVMQGSGVPAIFLDRDGTLIEDRRYLRHPEEVAFLPGAASGLRRLQDAGFLLFLVTNQSGVGRGYFTMEDVCRVHAHIEAELASEDVTFTAVYVAPEAPDQPSVGRKPSPAFLLEARDSFGLDLGRSYMIGDKSSDVEAGWNAGVAASILVRTGEGRDVERGLMARGGRLEVVDHLGAAADWILRDAAGGVCTS